MFLQTCECGVIFQNPFSDLTAQTFSGNKIYDILILPRGYQADDLHMSLISIHYSHIYFFRQHIKFSAIHVYGHICACPDKAAQMCFGS